MVWIISVHIRVRREQILIWIFFGYSNDFSGYRIWIRILASDIEYEYNIGYIVGYQIFDKNSEYI
jgi:hypothetical protein